MNITDLDGLRDLFANRREVLGVRLLARVDQGRITRATTVPIHEMQFAPNANSVVAVTGAGHYLTRILFAPSPSHHCRCPDWQQRRLACKHVVALGLSAASYLDLLSGFVEKEKARLEAEAARLQNDVDATALSLKRNLERKRVFLKPEGTSFPPRSRGREE